MKYKIILLCSCLCCGAFLHAQTQIILNTPDAGEKEYRATQQILLQPNYQYQANTTNMHAYIDDAIPGQTTYGPMNSNTAITNRQLNTNLPVGLTPGSESVTQSGGATYTIPIAVPIGTAGMQPQVSVSYNSQGGNGILGMGWDVTGLSAIARSAKSLYYNNKVEPIKMDATDNFLLDGQFIQAITGSNGGHNTIYGTEVESYSKITSYHNSGKLSWFKVETKSGIVMEYGNTEDSRFTRGVNNEVLLWRLNKITDQYGNYSTYVYKTENDQSRIHEIYYTGNTTTGLLPYNKVKFYYNHRDDKSKSFMDGNKMVNNFLLDRIVVTANDLSFKTYTFKYALNHYSFLTEVQEAGTDGTKLNSTIFKYGDAGTAMTIENSIVPGARDFLSGDFNGDGKSDILALPHTSCNTSSLCHTGYELLLNNGTTFSQVSSGSFNLETSVWNYKKSTNVYGPQAADYNGDGLTDFITVKRETYPYPHPANTNLVTSIDFYKSTGTGFQIIALPVGGANNSTSPSGFISDLQNNIISGDFDGDGATDILTLIANVSGSWAPYMVFPRVSNTNHPINNFGSILTKDIAESDDIRVIDFDGDGKDDLMVVVQGITAVYSFTGTGASIARTEIYIAVFPTSSHTFKTADFNGDGITDLISTINGTDWNVAYGNGKGWEQEGITLSPNPSNFSTFEHFNIADLNGDGKSDIYIGSGINSSTTLKVYLSYGNGFNSITHNFSNSFGAALLQGDWDGDGKMDLLDYTHISNPVKLIYFNKGAHHYALEKISNGHNSVTEFVYSYMTDNAIYTKGSGAAYPVVNVQGGVRIVKGLKIPNGIGGIRAMEYLYKGAKIHLQGKGFMGLDWFKTFDVNSKTEVTQSFNLNTQFFFPYSSGTSSLIKPNNIQVGNSQIAYNFTSLGGKRFKSEAAIMYVTDLIKGWTNTTTNTYDANGNITISEVDKVVEKITTTIQYGGPFNTTVPAHPISTTISNKRGTLPAYSRTTNYTYNSIGALETETIDPTLPKSVTKTLTYDKYGNILTSSLSATGQSALIESFVYDIKGRLPIEIKNTLDQVEKIEYDFKWGKPIKTTTINGLVSSMEYDVFGRLKKTTFPNNAVSTATYHWDLGNFVNDPSKNIQFNSSLFYLKSTAPNSPEVKTWYDPLGREIKSSVEHPSGVNLVNLANYDNIGNKFKVSEPFFENANPVNISTTSYDIFGRVTSSSNAIKTINYEYIKWGSNFMTKVKPSATQTKSKMIDQAGNVIESTDDGGTLAYEYNSMGKQTKVTMGGKTLVELEFDVYGMQTKLIDANAGTTEYEYDAFGQLVFQKDANNNISQMQYDVLGRVTSSTDPTGTTNYTYETSNAGLNKVKKIVGSNGLQYEYSYDNNGSLIKNKETIGTEIFETTYTLDNHGNNIAITYPSGFKVNYTYDSKGVMTKVADINGNTLFNNTQYNQFGKLNSYSFGNGINATNTYDQYGVLEKMKIGSIFEMEYDFELTTGNLLGREDKINNVSETFEYDGLDRLKSTKLSTSYKRTLSYETNGNISHQTDVGIYKYDNVKANALVEIDGPFSEVRLASPQTHQTFTYTAFDRTATIEENDYKMTFTYGPDHSRKMIEMEHNATSIYKRYYSGGYEKQVEGTDVLEIHYIPCAQGVSIYYVKENGTGKIYYPHKDYLGSVLLVTDDQGTVQAEQSFDARGHFRNPTDWTLSNAPTTNPKWLYRGYTGHEHYPEFTIINMNNRMYDPEVGRMLAVDNYIADPYSTQAYNRYSYALNNPLKYTDPSGELAWFVPVAFAAVNVGIDLFMSNGQMTAGQIAMSAGMGALGGIIGGGGITNVGVAIMSQYFSKFSSYMPSIPIYESNGLNIGISPFFGIGSHGFSFGANLNASGQVGNFAWATSVGIGYNTGMNSLGDDAGSSSFWNFGGFASYNKGGTIYGFGLSTNKFNKATKQRVGAIHGQIGDFTFRIDEDFFPGISDGDDKYRTGGLLATYRVNEDLTLAFGGSMLTGHSNGETAMGGNPNVIEGFWANCGENLFNLRGGTMFGGVIFQGQSYFVGHNSEKRLHDVQNWIHRNVTGSSPYFEDRMFQSKGYGYYGSYHPNYLYY